MAPTKIGTVKTIDAETGEVKAVQQNAMTMLPPAGDVCQCCAVDHDHDQPHNQQSMYWQYWFYGRHGRWPTWTDAMAHCTAEVQKRWREELVKLMVSKGITVPDDLQAGAAAGGR